ncbi:MAG: 4Fe-4S binding protein [Dehalococcoidia bacterium]|nr:4Fe-4S binding protein [Dehalococcoidia bacterium]
MEPREIHTSLLQKINVPDPNSEHMHKIIRKLVNPEEGRLLLALPGEPAELAAKTGMPEQTVQQKLREFMEKGLVVPTSKGLRLVRDVLQFHDANLSSSEKWVDQELCDLWRDWYEIEFMPLTEKLSAVPADGAAKTVRVVPAWRAIELSPDLPMAKIPPEENLRDLVKGADVIAVVPCTCRRSLRRCDAKVEICVLFNRGAEYAINRGAGRKVSAEEAMAIFREGEEAGLVHTWPFALSPRLNEICNCCRDCCILFDPGMKFGTLERGLAKSHLRAEVHKSVCDGCQDCVETCFFGAIEMKKDPPGKKLKAEVDPDKCYGCGACVVACSPHAHAIRMRLVD